MDSTFQGCLGAMEFLEELRAAFDCHPLECIYIAVFAAGPAAVSGGCNGDGDVTGATTMATIRTKLLQLFKVDRSCLRVLLL